MRSIAVLVLPLVSLTLAACSGGGGGGGGSSTNRSASGVLSLPKATCGSGVCVQAINPFNKDVSALSDNSAQVLHQNAEFGYNYINSTYIPEVNAKMYDVEEAFKSFGYTQCGGAVSDVTTGEPQINQIPLGTHAISSDFSVDVSAGNLTSPGDGSTTQRKFVLSKSGAPFLEVQIGCASISTRSLYIRLIESSSAFEAWGYTNGSAKQIYAGNDANGGTRTLFFKSTSATRFEIAAVLKNATLTADPLTLAISGGANLAGGSGVLDVQLLFSPGTALTASGGTYDGVASPYSGADTRHCYTNIEPEVTTPTAATCSGLFNGPSIVHLRGGDQDMSTWSVSGIGSDPINRNF